MVVTRSIIVTSEFITKPSTSSVAAAKQVSTATNEIDNANEKVVKSSKKVNTGFGTLTGSITKLRIGYFNLAVIYGLFIGSLIKLGKASITTSVELSKLASAAGSSVEQAFNSVKEIQGLTLESNQNIIESYQELTKSGFSLYETQNILKSSAGAAIVGFASLKETALATSQVIRQFGLDSSQATDIVYKLAAVANEGRIDIGNIGDALKFSGAIANEVGTGFEELSSAIAILSNKGLEAGQIGRGFRQVFLSLASQTSSADSALRAYNIQISDGKGGIKTYTELIDEFDKKLAGLTSEQKQNILSKIFPENAVTLILESLGETNTQIKDLLDNLDVLAEKSKLSAVTIQSNVGFTISGTWKKFVSNVEGNVNNLINNMNDFITNPSLDEKNILDNLKLRLGERGVSEDTYSKLFSPDMLLSERDKKQLTKLGFDFDYSDLRHEINTIISEMMSLGIITPEIRNDLANLIDQPTIARYNLLSEALNSIAVIKNKIKEKGPILQDIPYIKSLTGGKSVDITQNRNVEGSVGEMKYNLDLYDKTIKKVEDYYIEIEKIKSAVTDLGKQEQLIALKREQYSTQVANEIGPEFVNVFEDATDEAGKLKEANDILKQSYDKLIESTSAELDLLKESISARKTMIDTILNRRFSINGISETSVDSLLANLDLELKKSQFAALGLGTAEEFLRDATLNSSSSIEDQSKALVNLTNQAASAEDQFTAWQTTLEETIRALVLSSQDLDKDVTEVVRKNQTELLSITKGSSTNSTNNQFSALEEGINNVKLAQDIFFSEEKNKLQESEQLREDRINGVNTSAEMAISALESERSALDLLITKEKELNALLVEQQKLRNNIGNGNEPGYTVGTVGPATFSGSLADYLAQTGSHYTPPKNDFVYRPNQPAMSFSPQDTLIGVKDTSKLGSTSINVGNINIVGTNKSARDIALEVKRELVSLA